MLRVPRLAQVWEGTAKSCLAYQTQGTSRFTRLS